MQDRYTADIGDYVKVSLLRSLQQRRLLGVAWCMVPDALKGNDGKHTAYLSSPSKWRHHDPGVFDALHEIVRSGRRQVSALHGEAILGASRFFTPTLPASRGRTAWMDACRSALDDCDLVFFDPDNGCQTAPAEMCRPSCKHIRVDEVLSFRRAGRALVVYHHQTRRKGGHQAEIDFMLEQFEDAGFEDCMAIRVAPYSPRVFFVLDTDSELERRAVSWAQRWSGWATLSCRAGYGLFDTKGGREPSDQPDQTSAWTVFKRGNSRDYLHEGRVRLPTDDEIAAMRSSGLPLEPWASHLQFDNIDDVSVLRVKSVVIDDRRYRSAADP